VQFCPNGLVIRCRLCGATVRPSHAEICQLLGNCRQKQPAGLTALDATDPERTWTCIVINIIFDILACDDWLVRLVSSDELIGNVVQVIAHDLRLRTDS
jgi:hypothetical protein